MRLLAIETSGDECSCALRVDAASWQRTETRPRAHAERVLEMVTELLAVGGIEPRQLDAVVFGRGPGSFTGVRIATAVTQGFAWALGMPVIGVSSLAALAAGVGRRRHARRVAAALDARMGEIYWGLYRVSIDGPVTVVHQDALSVPGEFPRLDGDGWCGAGPGWKAYPEILAERAGPGLDQVDAEAVPGALDLLDCGAQALAAGDTVDAAEALPAYLRNQVAQRPARVTRSAGRGR